MSSSRNSAPGHVATSGGPLASAAVLSWYSHAARDLPWRAKDASPWAVMVSEVMLQQTPVARVLPIWTSWMVRWPSPSTLAEEGPAEAVRAWGKLGYPRRALRLHAAASRIAADHGGEVPTSVEALEALPGIGAYTARAIAAFAFGARTPVVDTNVARVVARAVSGRSRAGPSVTAVDRATVASLLPADPGRAARYSVAVMELGALVCTAAAPRCEQCPVRTDCAWQLAGAPADAGHGRRSRPFQGTDRQVRGLLLDVLRATKEPVGNDRLDSVWPDEVQRVRALDSLLLDGLVGQLADRRFILGRAKAELIIGKHGIPGK